MTPETFCEQFATFAEAPHGVAKLRELILQLAVQGKLVSQDVNDEPASVLAKQIVEYRKQTTGRSATMNLLNADELGFPLPSGWIAARFGDLMVNRDGERVPVSREIREGRKGPYDYYGASGVIDCIDEFLFDKPLLLIGEDGANLINRSTPIAFIAQGKYWVNNHAHVLDGISLDFLRYIELHINAIDLKPFVTGTAQPKMNQAKMNSIPIALPPLAEQRRIVGKVDQLLGLCDELAARQAARREARSALVGATLDRLVSARSAAEFPAHAHRLRDHFDRLFDTPTTLPQLRQAILQLAVQGQLVPQDPNDEPADRLLDRLAEALPTRVVDAPVEAGELTFPLPANWAATRLGNVARMSTGYVFKSPDYTPSGVFVLRVTNVKPDGSITKHDAVFIPNEKITPQIEKFYLNEGDILVVMVGGSLGKIGVVTADVLPALLNQNMWRIQPATSEFSRQYLRLLLEYVNRFQLKITASTHGHIAMGEYRTQLVAIPPLSEQKRIVSKVTELLSLCDALEAKLTQAESASTQLLAAAVHHLLNRGVSHG